MGNVKSSAVLPKIELPKPVTSVTPVIADPDVDTEKKTNSLPNPSSIEDLHKNCKDVMAMTFEGAKIVVNKGLSNHFQVSHTINLSNTIPSGYRFGATFIGTKQFTPSEAFPVLLGDIDASGNLNANIIHQFTSRIRCKFASQIKQGKMHAAQLSTDYRGDSYTATFTVGNLNILNSSGILVGHYLQSVTPNLSLGGEIAYHYGPQIPGGEISAVLADVKYISGTGIWSGSIGGGGIHLCYYQKASEQLQIGVEMEASLSVQESVATIGYQVDLPKADLVFRGMVDSNWSIGGVLEKRLHPLPFCFALSGRLNHSKNQFKLGCGLIIG